MPSTQKPTMHLQLIALAIALAFALPSAGVRAATVDGATLPVVKPDWAERSKPRKAKAEAEAEADIIRQSVRESIAEHDAEARQNAEPVRRHEQDTLRVDAHESFDQRMEEARTPGCLRPDGLKNQPTGWGPFQLGGLLALPFVAVAALRGKCN